MVEALACRSRLAVIAALAWSGAGCLTVAPDVPNKPRPNCTFSLAVTLGEGEAEYFRRCVQAVTAFACDGFDIDQLSSPFSCRGLQCAPSRSAHVGTLPFGNDADTFACDAGTTTVSALPAPQPARQAPAFERAVEARRSPYRGEAVSASERAALIAFHGALGGPSWINDTGWLGAPGTECSWAGVLCDEAGAAVTGLVFDGNFLAGQLPKALAALTQLRMLVIHNEPSVTGALPSELGSLGKLEVLSLQQTGISGSLPSTLGNASSLRVLRVADSDQTGTLPSSLGGLAKLEVLQINATGIGGAIPSSLGNLGALRALDLRLNEFSGPIPSSLGQLANLESLLLGWNDLSGPIPPGLGGLSKLTQLNLERNRLSGPIPDTLGSLGSLVGLTLDVNDLSGPIPDSLRNLSELRDLSLGFNRLSGPLPAWLPDLADSLRIVYLPDNQLSGPIPDLSALELLTDLHLAWNAFEPGPIPAWLAGPALDDLERLDLSRTQRTGTISDLTSLSLALLALGDNAFDPGPIPAWIGNAKTLKFLDLRGTQRNGSIPPFLGSLDNLESLFLPDNPFTPGPVPAFFNKAEFPRLKNLSLDGTARTGKIPAGLFTLPLSTLRLARNQLSGTIPKAVKTPLLTILDLSRNQLSGPLPVELGTQVRMQSLRLDGNKFTGAIPPFFKEELLDEDMIDGTIADPFGRVFPGIDLRYNALSSTDPALLDLLEDKHPDGADFRDTQTVAPAGLKAAVLGKDQVKLTWTPIPFSSGAGFYTIEVGKSAKGPFAVAGTTATKAVATFTVTGLKPNTQYFFRLKTTTPAHAANPNLLVSSPGAAVPAKTGK